MTYNTPSKTICMTICECEWSQHFSLTPTLRLLPGHWHGAEQSEQSPVEVNHLSRHSCASNGKQTHNLSCLFFFFLLFILKSLRLSIANLTLMPCSPLVLSELRLNLLSCSLHIFPHSHYLPDSPRFDSLSDALCLSVSVPSSSSRMISAAGTTPQVQHVSLCPWGGGL